MKRTSLLTLMLISGFGLAAQSGESQAPCNEVPAAQELVCKIGSRNVRVSIPKQSVCKSALRAYLNDTIEVKLVNTMVPMNFSVPLDKTDWGMYIVGPGDRLQEFMGPCINNCWESF